LVPKVVVPLILVFQIVAGATALAIDFNRPFSGSERTAAFLRTNHLDHLTIVGDPDTYTSPVAILLDRAVFYPNRQGFGTFVLWDRQRHAVDDAEVIDVARRFETQSPDGVVIVLDHRLAELPPDIRALFDSGDSVLPDEHFWVYGLGTNR
jgi:hypothetical protein